MKEDMPGNPPDTFRQPDGYLDRGPRREPRPGKASDITVTTPAGFRRVIPRYSDHLVRQVIEQGRTAPRVLSPDEVITVERARVAAKEDLRALELQFVGIGSSGSYGSLDGRNSRRPQQGSSPK